jgi:hypothetical protein
MKRRNYKADILFPEQKEKVWWPVSSDENDNMVIGDGIPGDKKTAELCARCCNIAYGQALEDIEQYFLSKGIDISKLLESNFKRDYNF